MRLALQWRGGSGGPETERGPRDRRDQGKINKTMKDINDQRAGRGKYQEMVANNNKTKCGDSFLFSLPPTVPQ